MLVFCVKIGFNWKIPLISSYLLVVTNSYGIDLFYSMPKLKKIAKKTAKTDDPTVELKKLGARIKALRIKKGYTNYENFAFEHDIPRAQFGRYERGEDLRYSSLLKVIRALGVTQKEFFSEGFD
jgi:hypothetical protein